MSSILIVDDEYDIAHAICGILEDEGYEVKVCSSGSQALQCIRETEREIQLILLDVMMPLVSGLEVLKQLRADKRMSKVPVVLMNNTELKVNQADYQWNDVLRKPFACKSLLETVERYVSNRLQD
jgi:DNA-binding response OmpR family regulator